jgi:putative transposase
MRPRRLPGVSYTGAQRYFVTCCTHNRLPWFAAATTVDAVWTTISRQASVHAMAVHAYCFMPDHLHLLLEGRAPHADLRRFVATMKQESAWATRSLLHGRLWQRGYHERLLRPSEPTLHVARYIVGNPVRASLVRTPAEYPFLGSATLTREELIASVGDGAP